MSDLDRKKEEMDETAFRAQMEEEERRRAATVQADLRQMAEEAAGKRSSYAEEVTQTNQAIGEAIGRTADSAAGQPENAAALSDQDAAEQERLAQERQELEREKKALQRRKQQLDQEDDMIRRERARAARRREEDEDDLRSRRRLGSQVDVTYDTEPEQEKPEGKKKKNPVVRFFRVLLVILLAGILLLCAAYYRMHGSIRLSQVKEKIAEQVSKDTTLTGYTNIALFGVDSIENSLDKGNNRSDVMIILSINNGTKEAKLVSVYRDTYLDIGDGRYTKANAAYAYGGPTQAVTMLNQNFDLDIEDYATIGFGGVADIIDALGGIDIDVKEDEIHYMNDYQSTMAQELGKTYHPVQAAGTQTLTGLQAVSYCRVRYTAGGDFTRTERQRTVLTQTFSRLKTASAAQMVSIATKLLSEGEVQTSLSMTEIASLAAGATQYSIGDSTGVPTESLRTDAYVDKQDCVIPVTLADNVTWLHEYLFGESGYQVSDTVQTISDQIRANTGH